MLRAGLRRITFDRAFVVVTVLWAVGLVVVLGGRLVDSLDDEEPRRPASVSAPTTTEPPTAEDITAAIEIESGFTAGVVWACDTAGGQAPCPPEQRESIGDTVSYGIVVENTSDQVVRGVRLEIQFMDVGGTVVQEAVDLFSDGDLASLEVGLPPLRSGERLGFGRVHYLDRPGAAHMSVEVSDLGEWMPEDYAADPSIGEPDPTGEPDTTIGGVAVGYGWRNEPIVTFSADWRTEAPGHVDALVVFRNSADVIIGGASMTLYPDGWTAGSSAGQWHLDVELAVDDPMEIPGIDPSRTEIYITDYSYE